MSKKASTAMIGLFVLGAIGLALAGVVLFGSGKLFRPTVKYVMYFDGSVKGLSVGAPVVFRGVKIGSVTDIILQGNLQEMRFTVPVIAEVDLGRFQISKGDPEAIDYERDLLDKGLRAQLQTQSLVTGQLMIDIDFRPERPSRLVANVTDYPQIPTIPSTVEEIAQKIEDLPIQQLIKRVNDLVGGLEQLVNSTEMQELPHVMSQAATEARTLLKTIDDEVGLLSADARSVLAAATAVIERGDRMLTFEEGVPAEMADSFQQLLAEARLSLRRFDETLAAVRSTASDERSKYELRRALNNLAETSQSLAILVEYLGRHPEALFWGKDDQGEQ
ncbi:MlaD family protein [Desulfofustis glycolicus]|uniref:Paraquat-inducible protein B n=1 Tax=Desulfofustis glycolicus DSM 9705 TaxID=1121409 RepID=A0A1M5YBE4_9BACT|nr:MlaD family protein [Desulfofustis glycolicus]MCB2217739.1 MCE family protein [Desulfobulbaceae bacterium]SHI09401.1 paraquat-inducible protein B [Desulfofustis glycolicus DSM 9705]